MNIIILILCFVSVVLLTLGTGGLFKSILGGLNDLTHTGESDLLNSPVGPVILAISGLFQGERWQNWRASIDRKLRLAGNPGNLTSDQFIACALLVSIAAFAANFFMTSSVAGASVVAIFFCLSISVVCFYLAFAWLESLIDDRKRDMAREFPYFVDLAVMAMSSGSSFEGVIETYSNENSKEYLAVELGTMISEVRVGKTTLEAMKDFDQRIDNPPVNNTFKAIIQGYKLGVPVAENLANQADAIRFLRSQNAERIAEEMKIRMQGPAMLLLVSVLILILGPAIVSLASGSIY